MATKTIGQLTQATTIDNLDEFAIQSGGITKRIAASVVRGEIVNANIKSDAAIALTKLAALNSAEIVVGNGSNVPTAVAVTGDVTISNAGVTAIGADKVVTASILDANVTPAKLAQPFTMETAQASTSGTSIDFTGIPSYAKRITVILSGVSTNGTSIVQVQIGAASFLTSGYISAASTNGSSVTSTTGFVAGANGGSGDNRSGCVVITNISPNAWVASGSIGNNANCSTICGTAALSDTLDRVRITTVNGTDTFDDGAINISYEG